MLPHNFPLINQLPPLLVADSWEWTTETMGHHSDLWLGIDPNGNKWLVKMRGSFYSYREHAFAALAQMLGLSCQSSVYLRLPLDNPLMQNGKRAEEYHLAIWWYEHHDDSKCSSDCPVKILYEQLNDPSQDQVTVLRQSAVKNAIDMARAEILAHLCCANETSEFIYTPDHELIIIDNEEMFSYSPSNLFDATVMEGPNNRLSAAGMEEAIELCDRLTKITDSEIESITAIPRLRCQRTMGNQTAIGCNSRRSKKVSENISF